MVPPGLGSNVWEWGGDEEMDGVGGGLHAALPPPGCSGLDPRAWCGAKIVF